MFIGMRKGPSTGGCFCWISLWVGQTGDRGAWLKDVMALTRKEAQITVGGGV